MTKFSSTSLLYIRQISKLMNYRQNFPQYDISGEVSMPGSATDIYLPSHHNSSVLTCHPLSNRGS